LLRERQKNYIFVGKIKKVMRQVCLIIKESLKNKHFIDVKSLFIIKIANTITILPECKVKFLPSGKN